MSFAFANPGGVDTSCVESARVIWGAAESARSQTPRQGTVFEDFLNHARRSLERRRAYHLGVGARPGSPKRCVVGTNGQAGRQTEFIHFLVAAHLGLRTRWNELNALLIV